MVVLAVWLLTLRHDPETGRANRVVQGNFLLDSVVRLGQALDRRPFVHEHLSELIAILPWDEFRVARILRLIRLLRAGV